MTDKPNPNSDMAILIEAQDLAHKFMDAIDESGLAPTMAVMNGRTACVVGLAWAWFAGMAIKRGIPMVKATMPGKGLSLLHFAQARGADEVSGEFEMFGEDAKPKPPEHHG